MTASLFGALGSIPTLSGAACRGRADEFDIEPSADPERIERAIHVCAACPALTCCRQCVSSLPPSKRPSGVVAGELREWAPRRKKVSA